MHIRWVIACLICLLGGNQAAAQLAVENVPFDPAEAWAGEEVTTDLLSGPSSPLLPATLVELAERWTKDIALSAGRTEDEIIIETPYRDRSVAGHPGIAVRVILPSEAVRAEAGYWDVFELTLSYNETAWASGVEAAGQVLILVSDYRKQRRGFGRPSIASEFQLERAEVAWEREAAIASLYRRTAERPRVARPSERTPIEDARGGVGDGTDPE